MLFIFKNVYFLVNLIKLQNIAFFLIFYQKSAKNDRKIPSAQKQVIFHKNTTKKQIFAVLKHPFENQPTFLWRVYKGTAFLRVPILEPLSDRGFQSK